MVPSLTRDAKLVNGDLHTVRVAKNRSLACRGAEPPDELVAKEVESTCKKGTSIHMKRSIKQDTYVLYMKHRRTCIVLYIQKTCSH